MFWHPFVSLDLLFLFSSHTVILLSYELMFLLGYSLVGCTCAEFFFSFLSCVFLGWLFVCLLHALCTCVCVCTLHTLILVPFHFFLPWSCFGSSSHIIFSLYSYSVSDVLTIISLHHFCPYSRCTLRTIHFFCSVRAREKRGFTQGRLC